VTERLARAAARRPKRTLALWGLVFLLSIGAIAALLPSALTTDADVTSSPESRQGYDVIRERIPRRPQTSSSTSSWSYAPPVAT